MNEWWRIEWWKIALRALLIFLAYALVILFIINVIIATFEMWL